MIVRQQVLCAGFRFLWAKLFSQADLGGMDFLVDAVV